MALLAAVMLEKSIICYGPNLNKVSGVILGLESLLRPFGWSMALIPILPRMLLDTLEAPVPILAGITSNEFEEACKNLTKEEIESKIWINAETGNVIFESDPLYQPAEFGFGNMKRRLQPKWTEL